MNNYNEFRCKPANNDGYIIERGVILKREEVIALDDDHAVALFREWLEGARKARSESRLAGILRSVTGIGQ